MKTKSLLTLLFLVTLLTSALAQTTRRVNNNPGITGTNVYATFADAHTAAATNDIIIIEPSANSYGTITLTKPLKIYGNGYFLEANPELKADKRQSTFVDIILTIGSSGSEIYGVNAGNVWIRGVSNIILSNNAVVNYLLYGLSAAIPANSNITLTKSYISDNIGFYNGTCCDFPAPSNTNIVITNNIVDGILFMSATRDQAIVIRNNTFKANQTGTIVNANLENNFYFAGSTLTLSNVTASNNVSTGVTFTGGTANVNSYDYNANAELVGVGAGISADKVFQVKPGKPLKTLGSGGTEVGAYGGLAPYVISGIPPIPSITTFSSTDTGDNTTPIKVNISIKSNN
jgi:Right handed beta helix region